MFFNPPHAMFEFAEQYAMPHDRRMVLREGLANSHLTVLQIIQLAAVIMQQKRVLVENTGMLGQDTRVLVHGLRDL